ncbi:MAG: hypothetical protein KIT79_09195 [Deltaproteobacteria bacterium]|nr:hypothetical protein [Deltaproteobacteria bacterium]
MGEPETRRRWRCSWCGFEHDGPAPVHVCDVCGAPGDEFVEVAAKTAETAGDTSLLYRKGGPLPGNQEE